MSTRIPPIREFPNDGRIWRIDWLGAVERTSFEALIDVFLSPAKPGVLRPEKQEHFDPIQVARVQIGVGQLPFLVVGTFWKNRRRLAQVAGRDLALADVHISPDTVKLVEAGMVLSEVPKRWMIPPYDHVVDKRAMPSRCLAIEYGDDPYGIILPVAEAVRFYYAVSTDLAHIVFGGGFQLDLNRIINTDDFGMAHGTQRMYLKRRRWLSNEDGWIIGRVLESPLAAAGVALVYNSLLRNSANTAAVFPECSLPFDGSTRWQARGVQISRGRGNRPRFLVHELIRCSAPFPFRELHVDADNDAEQAQDSDNDLPDEEKQSAWSTPSKAARRSPDDELQSALPPDADIGAAQVFLPGDRFDDIAGKEIIRTPKEQCRYKTAALRRPQGLDALSTGDGSCEESAIGSVHAELEREVPQVRRSEGLPASFESLHAVIEALNQLDGVTASIRTPTERIELLRLSAPTRQWQWAYLDSSRRVRRRVVIVDIACEDSNGCVVEYERRPTERSRLALFTPRVPGRVPEGVLIQLLDELVSVEGVWARMKRCPSDVTLRLFNHSRPSAGKFASVLRTALLQESSAIQAAK